MSKALMTTTTETVTPAMAQKWLEQNYENNRVLKPGWVEQLAARMRAGHWQLTHQGIAFDGPSGRLIDGQHRLWAIVLADIPVEMSVSRNVPREAFKVLDQHRVRSVADLAGDKRITPRLVGCARAMARGPSQSHVGLFDDRDPTLLLEFIDEHRETMERVHALLPTDKRTRGRSNLTVPVMGALYRAANHVPLKKLQRFIEVYIGGISEAHTEVAAILLRDWVMGRDVKDRTVVYQKTQRAIAAFMDDDPIKILYAAPDDLYPLPGKEPRALRGTKARRRPRPSEKHARARKADGAR